MAGVVDATTTRATDPVCVEICERIACGESTAEIFERTPHEGYPNRATFWRWRIADKPLDQLYRDAITERGLLHGEQIVDAASEEPPMVSTQFGEKVDAGWVQWQRNRVDALKWDAARMQSRLYGDRTILAGDADNPVVVDDPKGALLRGIVPHARPPGTGEENR